MQRQTCLKRDLVVDIRGNRRPAAGTAGAGAAARPAAVATARPAAAGLLAAHIRIVVIGAAFHRTAATSAVEHRQLAAEALQDDFSREPLHSLVVGPFPGLQRTLDV